MDSPKGKERKAYQKQPDEEQSRKRFRQWISHRIKPSMKKFKNKEKNQKFLRPCFYPRHGGIAKKMICYHCSSAAFRTLYIYSKYIYHNKIFKVLQKFLFHLLWKLFQFLGKLS